MKVDFPEKRSALNEAISLAYRRDETECVETLLNAIQWTPQEASQIADRARRLVSQVRNARKKEGGMDAFMQQYDLSSEEGIALMCLAEALLRIPDNETIDKLLEDKLGSANWKEHLGESDSLFVNAATWSLMLTGKLYSPKATTDRKLWSSLKSIAGKGGGAFIRKAANQGMKYLGKQFVMGRTIEEALKRAVDNEKRGYLYSYDMLGEAAHTTDDALRYHQAYIDAIHAIGKQSAGKGPFEGPGISVKLSALHPRYEVSQRLRVMHELVPRLMELARLAKSYNIGLTVDAEEADRLELSLEVMEVVFGDSSLEGWEGFGLAVQAYQKRAPFVIDWLVDLSQKVGRRLMVRLVKGAYWDSEIKLAQQEGFSGYPVFTRKNNTDVSYLACAKKLLSASLEIYPQFATHNAHSLAVILAMADENQAFEFQCLHGMGHTLYDHVVGKDNLNRPCRVYAPVGQHEDLLAYLVRRLLENGANTSFVNRISDEGAPIEKIIEDPVKRVANLAHKPHPHIPLPKDLYGNQRRNSTGVDLSDTNSLVWLQKTMHTHGGPWSGAPLVVGYKPDVKPKAVVSPQHVAESVGSLVNIDEQGCEIALNNAVAAAEAWDAMGANRRAKLLEAFGNKLEEHMPELMAIVIKEAGKTLVDAVAEVREAVDFCRYYAVRARHDLTVKRLPGPTGELNQLYMHGRGPFLCISPWNFPLAIFVGQVTAALVAGNPVLAKPADQTPLIATRAVELMHEVGIPKEVMQLVPGRGSVIGARLVADERVKGIMFTGSTETAKVIQKTLADRNGDIIPFIAETGGQNAMIVDSSALPEQVVVDVVLSAFGSAGQRCSALRVLFLQDDVADNMLEMLKGAMVELQVGDPACLSTDVGPVIDVASLEVLENHFQRMSKEAKLIYQVPLGPETKQGTYFAPCVFELNHLSQLEREVFGPFLHVIRYKAGELDQVIDDIKNTGYGLTFGVHSRISSTVEYLQQRLPVGNTYVNRNMTGAVVGVQPFGGEGLSGTGPKAGGPHYLTRLAAERTLSVNTTATGGNASLLSLPEDD